MPTTSIDLGEHFTGFVNTLKNRGRYRNVSEAIRAGLRLLEEHEAEYQAKLEVLNHALIEGEESGESTRTHEEIIKAAKAELNAE